MKILSQRDSKWSKNNLGFTTDTTIGSHGCTITCVAMLTGYTPDVVNERLKAVNGYASGNLILWSKIKEALENAEFEWRGYSYENDRVKGAIAKNGGCLVEVDGTPIGGFKHWVLYVGNGKLYDPWDGKEKSTGTYTATGYSIINVLGEPGGDMADTITIPTKTFEELVTKSTKYDEFSNAGFYTIEDLRTRIAQLENSIKGHEETNRHLNTLLSEKSNQLSVANSRISTFEGQVLELESRVNSLTEQAKKVPKLEEENEYLNEQRTKWQESEKSYNKVIAQLKSENEALKTGSIKTIIIQLLNSFKNWWRK